MVWKLEELANLVEVRHGTNQKMLLGPLLNSSWRKLEIAKYHAIESKRLVDSYFTTDEFESYNKAIRFIFDRINGDEEAIKFYEASFLAEAHVVAYSQSMHSVYDILGQVIIHSLDISRYFRAGENIYLSTVKSKMERHRIGNGINHQITACLNNPKFQYLRAFVNTNKHICLLNMPYTVNMEVGTQQAHGIKIPAFKYAGEVYPDKWAKEFVTEEYSELSKDVVALGNSINEHLR